MQHYVVYVLNSNKEDIILATGPSSHPATPLLLYRFHGPPRTRGLDRAVPCVCVRVCKRYRITQHTTEWARGCRDGTSDRVDPRTVARRSVKSSVSCQPSRDRAREKRAYGLPVGSNRSNVRGLGRAPYTDLCCFRRRRSQQARQIATEDGKRRCNDVFVNGTGKDENPFFGNIFECIHMLLFRDETTTNERTNERNNRKPVTPVRRPRPRWVPPKNAGSSDSPPVARKNNRPRFVYIYIYTLRRRSSSFCHFLRV